MELLAKVNLFYQICIETHLNFAILKIDINECVNANPCGEGTCSNTYGSFTCECKTGYRPGSDQVCEGVSQLVS
jgi:hypothetical protein